MSKVGILTFHYSNNYGGVLQSYALYRFLQSLDVNVEIVDYVPSSYRPGSLARNLLRSTGLRRNPQDIDIRDFLPRLLLTRALATATFTKRNLAKFEAFRHSFMHLSGRVDEHTIHSILPHYTTVVVGSDQIWGPEQRGKPVYFLGFDDFSGKRVSYAADSTTAEVSSEHLPKLTRELERFDHISVRNEHSPRFVETITGHRPPVVVDPTLLWGFDELSSGFMSDSEPYIAVYVLGKDIHGSNVEAIKSIKRTYGDLKVYAVIIPTMKFNPCEFADRVFYDLGPEQWLDMIRHAAFVFTDSFHGTLFSLKFHRPFLAYHVEEKRSTRFIDLGKRYQIERYIVTSVDEIDAKGSLLQEPDHQVIDRVIDEHRDFSIKFLKEALEIDGKGLS